MINRITVLVACEYTATVRDEFRKLGHDAWSCDLLPTEGDPRWHVEGDARVVVRSRPWDLLIHHSPCTYSINAGARWLYKGGKGSERDEKRWQLMEDGARFFRQMQDSPVPKVIGENPIPHSHALKIMGRYAQIVQPWQHGDRETKATCLWLTNAEPLKPTDIVGPPPRYPHPDYGKWARVHYTSPSPNRGLERSRFPLGLAKAFALHWGGDARIKELRT